MKRYFTICGPSFSCFSKLLLLVLVFIHSGTATGQEPSILVERIVLEGGRSADRPDLQELTGIQLPADLSRSDLMRVVSTLNGYYTLNGYPFFEIGSIIRSNGSGENSSILTFNINEGPLCIFNEITISGENEFPEEIFEQGFPRKGSRYSLAEVQSAVDIIAEYYNNSGYPYHVVSIEDISFILRENVHEADVKVILEVSKNEKTIVDSILVEGNDYTRDNVLIRESRLKTGEMYQERNLKKAQEFIEKLAYIEQVDGVDLITGSAGEPVVRITVEEQNPNRFDGLIGYIPSGSEEKGYYVGSFRLGLGNIFGTGRRLIADWKRPDRTSQDLYLSYSEPWVFGFPADITGELAQVVQDTTFVRRRFTIGAEISLRDRFSANLSFGFEEIIPDEENGALFGIEGSNSKRYSVGIAYEHMDNIYNPRNGVQYSTTITHQFRDVENATDNNLRDQIVNARIEAARQVTGGFVTYLKAAWDQTFTSEDTVPVSQQWYLGGAESLRGYSEKQFRASTVTWYNLELRYLLGADSRVFLFQDGGFFSNKSEKVRRKFGYGFGMRVQTGIGIVGFDFGLGDGDSFSAAKVHVKLQSTF